VRPSLPTYIMELFLKLVVMDAHLCEMYNLTVKVSKEMEFYHIWYCAC
jgi:hypothetical protein